MLQTYRSRAGPVIWRGLDPAGRSRLPAFLSFLDVKLCFRSIMIKRRIKSGVRGRTYFSWRHQRPLAHTRLCSLFSFGIRIRSPWSDWGGWCTRDWVSKTKPSSKYFSTTSSSCNDWTSISNGWWVTTKTWVSSGVVCEWLSDHLYSITSLVFTRWPAVT